MDRPEPHDESDDSHLLDYCLEGHQLRVYTAGPELRDTLLDLIDGARHSLKFFFYIFANDGSGRLVLARLIRAARRGVDVTLLVDAFGSVEVPYSFFDGLVRAGGHVRRFHSGWSTRSLIRNHQKIAIADDSSAIVGGCNVADAYFGIPSDDCWYDLCVRMDGPQVESLARWYGLLREWMWAPRPRFRGLRALVRQWTDAEGSFRWLVGGPTTRLSAWARAVRHDFERARRVDMVAAYFSPGNGMLARLRAVAMRGQVRLVLPSRSDNTATVAASRLLYGPLLRRGVEIHEYQPRRLHMKLIVVDNAVYIGSANFDMRSLFLNVEIMLRVEDAGFAGRMREVIDGCLPDSERITLERHAQWRTPWRLLKGWISYFLVGVLDYKITRRLNFRE